MVALPILYVLPKVKNWLWGRSRVNVDDNQSFKIGLVLYFANTRDTAACHISSEVFLQSLDGIYNCQVFNYDSQT